MDCANPEGRDHEEAAGQFRTNGVRPSERSNSLGFLRRFARFCAVGAGGAIVQMVTLGLLLRFAEFHYLAATTLAVETAVIHNFFWHRRWTWADRPSCRVALSLLRFNVTNGATSMIGNLAVMLVLVGMFRLDPIVANLITIGVCSIVSFALADRLVFI